MENIDQLAEDYILENWPDDIEDLEIRNSIKFAYIDGYNAARYTFIPVHHKNNCIYIDNDDLNLSINV